MSPLACSLFALAALLATAHGHCTTKHIGQRTSTEVTYERIYFDPPGVEVNLDENNNCPPQMQVVGEDITTCNNDPDGPAPHIDGPYPPLWSYTVTCPMGAYTDTKQYCGYILKN